jgi:alpha-ketoglutarate-dependent taurine dioxygenase
VTSVPVSPIGRGIGAVIEPSHGEGLLDLDRDRLIALYRSTGAVLLRGFEATIEAFEALSSALTTDLFTNRGAAFSFGPFKRSVINGNPTLMSATGARQDFPLPLHGEFHYFKHPPAMIWFYCQNPAPEGGQTTIGDGVEIMRALSEETLARIRSRRIKYERYLEATEWRTAFQTDNRDDVEAICRDNDTVVRWSDDGALHTEYICDAYIPGHDAPDVFINGVLPVALGEEVVRSGQIATLAPGMAGTRPTLVVRWEDGSIIEKSVIAEMLAVTAKLEVPVPAGRGDLLVVDNTRIMHGRRPSSAADRKVVVRMGSPRF